MAGGRLKLNGQQLNELQNRLMEVAAGLSEVAGGGYVPSDAFAESTGGATAELNQCIQVLAVAADMMYDTLRSTASYFETVIDRFDQWDRGEAVIIISGPTGFDSAVAEYQNELQNQRSDPFNLPQSTGGPQPTSEPQAPPVEPYPSPQQPASPQPSAVPLDYTKPVPCSALSMYSPSKYWESCYTQPTDESRPTATPQPTVQPQPPSLPQPTTRPQPPTLPQPNYSQPTNYPQPTTYPRPTDEPQLPAPAQPEPPPVAPLHSTPAAVPPRPTPSPRSQPPVYPQQTTRPQPPVESQPEPQPASPSATPTP